MFDETLNTTRNTPARPPRAMGLVAAAILLAAAMIAAVLAPVVLALLLGLDAWLAAGLVGGAVLASLAFAAWAGQRLASPLTRLAAQAEALRALVIMESAAATMASASLRSSQFVCVLAMAAACLMRAWAIIKSRSACNLIITRVYRHDVLA